MNLRHIRQDLVVAQKLLEGTLTKVRELNSEEPQVPTLEIILKGTSQNIHQSMLVVDVLLKKAEWIPGAV